MQKQKPSSRYSTIINNSVSYYKKNCCNIIFQPPFIFGKFKLFFHARQQDQTCCYVHNKPSLFPLFNLLFIFLKITIYIYIYIYSPKGFKLFCHLNYLTFSFFPVMVLILYNYSKKVKSFEKNSSTKSPPFNKGREYIIVILFYYSSQFL